MIVGVTTDVIGNFPDCLLLLLLLLLLLCVCVLAAHPSPSACEGLIVTAGGIDTHIHYICPQQYCSAHSPVSHHL